MSAAVDSSSAATLPRPPSAGSKPQGGSRPNSRPVSREKPPSGPASPAKGKLTRGNSNRSLPKSREGSNADLLQNAPPTDQSTPSPKSTTPKPQSRSASRPSSRPPSRASGPVSIEPDAVFTPQPDSRDYLEKNCQERVQRGLEELLVAWRTNPDIKPLKWLADYLKFHNRENSRQRVLDTRKTWLEKLTKSTNSLDEMMACAMQAVKHNVPDVYAYIAFYARESESYEVQLSDEEVAALIAQEQAQEEAVRGKTPPVKKKGKKQEEEEEKPPEPRFETRQREVEFLRWKYTNVFDALQHQLPRQLRRDENGTGPGVSWSVVDSKEPLYLPDVTQEPKVCYFEGKPRNGAFRAYPLTRTSGEYVGVIGFDNLGGLGLAGPTPATQALLSDEASEEMEFLRAVMATLTTTWDEFDRLEVEREKERILHQQMFFPLQVPCPENTYLNEQIELLAASTAEVAALDVDKVGDIKKAKPNPKQLRVLQAIVLFLGHSAAEYEDWNECKKIYADPAPLLQKIQEFDALKPRNASMWITSKELTKDLVQDDAPSGPAGTIFSWFVAASVVMAAAVEARKAARKRTPGCHVVADEEVDEELEGVDPNLRIAKTPRGKKK